MIAQERLHARTFKLHCMNGTAVVKTLILVKTVMWKAVK